MNDIRAELCRRFAGDQQGFYVAELRMILRGKINEPITDAHLEALIRENKEFINGHSANSGSSPF